MSELAKSFSMALDRWYKVVLIVGLGLSAAALFTDVKVLGNAQALRLGVALACLGMAAWKGEKVANHFIPPSINHGLLHATERVFRWDIIAAIFAVASAAFFAWFAKVALVG